MADIHLYYVMNVMLDRKAADHDLLASLPHIAAIIKKVESSPKIAEWVAKRPETSW